VPYSSKIAQFSRVLSDLPLPPNPVSPDPLHVLLVEPNECMRECLTALLNHYKYHVTCAANICDAVASATQCPPHAVILSSDFRGPEDFAICTQLRTIPETASSIFLGITGYYFEGMYKFAKSAGFDQYYLKPVLLTTFMTILNSMLSHQSHLDTAHAH
jgi:CheY-like chemotaxis protein